MWRSKMSKNKKKLREVLADECEDTICNDAGSLLHTVYETSDKLRTVAQTSQEMNNLSEAFDNMMNILIKMKPEEIQVVQRLW